MRANPRVGGRRLVAAVVTLSAAVGLAACGSSGPSAGGSAKGLTMWALNDQTILRQSVDAFNKDHPDEKITLRLFANDDYKQKLRVAFGAGQAPDLFFNWGGGALDDYVKAGKATALTTAEVNADLTAAVTKLKAKGVVPLSLAANSKWPTLMYMEYLLDRVGGSQVFSKIASGDSSAWNDPAVTKANQYLQDLAISRTTS